MQTPPHDWERSGKGRELQFFALDEEIDSWLRQYAPETYAPYSLCGFDRIRHGKAYEWRRFRLDEFSLLKCQIDAPERTQLWAASLEVSGGYLDELKSEREFATAGLILIQHGSVRRGLREGTRIAVVDKVVSESTGRTRVHSEYRSIFAALAKGIRKHLAYATVLPDSNVEDTKVALMTEAAAAASCSGWVEFSRRPGRRVS